MKKITLHILMIVIAMTKLQAQSSHIDSLQVIAQQATEDSVAIETHLQIVDHTYRRHPDIAEEHIILAKNIAAKSKDQHFESPIRILEIKVASSRRDILKVDSIAQSTLGNITSHKKDIHLLKIYTTLQKSYLALSEHAKSVDFGLRAEQLAETIPDTMGLMISIINTGVSLRRQKNLDEAYSKYQKAFKLAQTVEHKSFQSTCLMNMAIIDKINGNFEKALALFRRAEKVELSQDKIDDIGLSYVYGNMSSLYSETGELKKSIEYSKKNLELRKDKATNAELSNAYLGLAVNYEKTNNLALARANIEKAKTYDHTEYVTLKNVYKLSALIHEKLGNYRQSYKDISKSMTLQDSIYSTARVKQINELTTKYETEKKEQQIALLDAQNELNSTKLKNSRFWIVGLIVALLLFSLVLAWLYQLYQRIRQADAEKDILLKEIHHRVKNNLQVISALLSLQSRYIRDDAALDALKRGHDRVESMALIHRDLYQQDNLKGVSTRAYLESLIENLMESYQIEDHHINLSLDIDDIWLDVETMIPLGLTINELISNAMKHAFVGKGDGALDISLKEKNGQLILNVKDNGHGVDDIELIKSSSFGYSLIESFSKKLGAAISHSTDDGFGTRMTITKYKKAS